MIRSIDSPVCKHGWSVLHPQPCPECEEEEAPKEHQFEHIFSYYATKVRSYVKLIVRRV